MSKLYIPVFTAIILIFTCHTAFAQKDKEKEKPVSYNDSVLYGGCWFLPHNSDVSIRFSAYANFKFHDIGADEREVVTNGKYLLDGHNLWLIYDDRPKQKFYFYKTGGADAHFVIQGYPIEHSGYYFVHGECE